MKKTRFLNLKKWLICVSTATLVLSAISCSEDEKDTEPVIEPFYGKYSGGWWSNAANGSVYENIGASAIIDVGTGARWTGEFFYTRNYRSCCGNSTNDGTISFNLVDSVITSFRYSGTVPNCNGSFQGEGVVTPAGSIEIVFTGSDCEGEHEGGMIKLFKVN
ncbi:MAG: hypothetical protein JXR03_10825 [Cyclobacteriaceae bacterium]